MPCASSAATSVTPGGGGASRRPSRRSAPRSAARPSSRLKRAIPASRSAYTPRSFLCWGWRTGWAISPRQRTIPWACSSKKKTCRSAFAWRAGRNARKTSDGQRGSRIRGSRRLPAPDGSSVGPYAQEQGKRHLRIRQDMAGKSRAILSGASPAGWSRPVSHAGRHAHVRRHWRLRARPLGARAHAPHGTQARGARGRGAAHAPGNRLPAAGGRRGPSGRAALCGKRRRTLPAGGGIKRIPPLIELPETALRGRTCDGRERHRRGTATAVRAGSSLGGARPKASVREKHGHLAIAKFPRKDDEINTVVWEAVALSLARKSGIPVPQSRVENIAGKPVLLLRRFDRDGERRIPFLSAMSMLGSKDRETRSYLEIVDALRQHGAAPKADMEALWRRVVFNILISNSDDHLRNHGFL